MATVPGKINHADGDFTIALAAPSPDGNGFKVVSFPEPGGTYEVTNNVPKGKGEGEFSED